MVIEMLKGGKIVNVLNTDMKDPEVIKEYMAASFPNVEYTLVEGETLEEWSELLGDDV